ncbi:GCN5-related N-acetyltransferase [Catenulispora acidiphila DSM 44928]|uniref:GCN5-related N-acetyltransferase n=1 Tax=Catenulispora acidiphila (strain DSM 44928 / JCM 14897 / NBRC 102108 / NRRL B-24433 / ID139908) TaxID=479433 RepID=C7QIG5_CATAD|nr:GNAT family N-acetyltransferase [Catenulispora acidiphila]ACU75042.1 GCN5-related N-acetyltransferase [Catenulispora acidiphila DSM 44928]
MRIRVGGRDDVPVILAFGDEAVAWMNARGNTQQWGTAAWTSLDKRREAFLERADGGGMRVLEDEDGTALGVMVISEQRQPYVPEAEERELYVNFLIISRAHAGRGIGRLLIERAKQEAAERGIDLLRVDCWAGEDGNLVKVYERYGFVRVKEFTVAEAGDWPGMLLAMRLSELPEGERPEGERPGAGS